MAQIPPKVKLTEEQRDAAPKEKTYEEKLKIAKLTALSDPENAAIIIAQRDKMRAAKVAGAQRDYKGYVPKNGGKTWADNPVASAIRCGDRGEGRGGKERKMKWQLESGTMVRLARKSHIYPEGDSWIAHRELPAGTVGILLEPPGIEYTDYVSVMFNGEVFSIKCAVLRPVVEQ
jgi:hypothetical protein